MPKLTRKQMREYETAHHEASHAVIGCDLLGLRSINNITIIRKGNALGCTKSDTIIKPVDYEIDNSASFESKIMRQIMTRFAGHVAAKKFTGRENNVGASDDFEIVEFLLDSLATGRDQKASRYLRNYLYRRTELLVKHKWSLIKAVAKELLVKKTLDRDEFKKILIKWEHTK